MHGGGDQLQNGKLTSNFNQLYNNYLYYIFIFLKDVNIHIFRQFLNEMDTIIGCITDQLPEQAPFDNPKEVMKSIIVRLKNSNM